MRIVRARLLTAGLLFAGSVCAHALVFQEYIDAKGNHVLVARDCRNFSMGVHPYAEFDEAHGCRGGAKREGVTGAGDGYPGDGAVLDYILSLSAGKGTLLANLSVLAGGAAGDAGTAQTIAAQQSSPHSFAEVWLNSGGGDVDAGVEMARVLRKHRMTVRVPSGYQCISACTITFMGGVLRFMDDGAAFRVHSASMYEGGINKKLAAAIADDPDKALFNAAREQQIDSRYMALRLLTLFQNTLLVPLRAPMQPESDRSFCDWAGGDWETDGPLYACLQQDTSPKDATHFPYLDPKSQQRAADVARIKLEGPAAIQDILMRIERDAMTLAITDLEASLPNRGPRAKPALNMIRAMFMTSITDTSYMTRNQMVTMGYLTPIFEETGR